MLKQLKWFERKFDFNFSLDVFPSILERLRGTPARLEETIHSLPKNILTVKVNNGWSIQEHAGHLFDLDELHDARIDDYLAQAKTLRTADLGNKKTYDANHNTKPAEEILKSFRTARLHFVKRLEELDEEIVGRTAVHPRLQQPMRLIDMAYFVAEHDDHHLVKIRELSKIL